MKTARIHSFESFGAVDGPGLRFVVFFQGCSLRCKCCHNRDLWDFKAGKEWSVIALLSEVQKYRPWFDASCGGVTASGGEPLLQAAFLVEFFERCRSLGISTVLDTSGGVPLTDDVCATLERSDLVLLDIKNSDSAEYGAFTGAKLSSTLAIAEYLSDHRIPTRIRQVIIPGLTDSLEQIKTLAEYVSQMHAVEMVELLPFHQLGAHKWAELNDEYELANILPPNEDKMEELRDIFRNVSIPVR